MERSKRSKTISTEEKIKEAARKVFTRKGFAATRTRDIAEEAGINLALLNYYFRSKEKLFQQVMAEKIQELFGTIIPVMNDSATSLDTKLKLITENYTDTIIRNPDLPLFVLSEIRNNPGTFTRNFDIDRILNSDFIAQLRKKQPDLHPLHFVMNMLGLIIFPYIARPVLKEAADVQDDTFKQLMTERKKLVPRWVHATLETG